MVRLSPAQAEMNGIGAEFERVRRSKTEMAQAGKIEIAVVD
jgi:hypothetical protein